MLKVGKDSSPFIAADELRRAREDLKNLPRRVQLDVRAMFVERDRQAFSRLAELCKGLEGVEIQPVNGAFEDVVSQAVEFAGAGRNPFAFILVDPTGWTGYGLKAIAPLLRVRPGEVLINFMTKDIIRFVDDEDSSALGSFVDLFGDEKYRDEWKGLAGLEREDAIVDAYCRRVREAGGFKHVVSTVVLHPDRDRTHYHLIYATRSDAGLIAFRDVEAKALPQQQQIRAEKRRKKDQADDQIQLFEDDVLDASVSDYVTELMERYGALAEADAESRLKRGRPVPYDDLLSAALQFPTYSEKRLKEWIDDRRRAGHVQVDGLQGREYKPKRGKNHRIRWIG